MAKIRNAKNHAARLAILLGAFFTTTVSADYLDYDWGRIDLFLSQTHLHESKNPNNGYYDLKPALAIASKDGVIQAVGRIAPGANATWKPSAKKKKYTPRRRWKLFGWDKDKVNHAGAGMPFSFILSRWNSNSYSLYAIHGYNPSYGFSDWGYDHSGGCFRATSWRTKSAGWIGDGFHKGLWNIFNTNNVDASHNSINSASSGGYTANNIKEGRKKIFIVSHNGDSLNSTYRQRIENVYPNLAFLQDAVSYGPGKKGKSKGDYSRGNASQHFVNFANGYGVSKMKKKGWSQSQIDAARQLNVNAVEALFAHEQSKGDRGNMLNELCALDNDYCS